MFIDDSSKDGTINEIRSIIKIDKSVILKVRKIKDGIGSALSLLWIIAIKENTISQ